MAAGTLGISALPSTQAIVTLAPVLAMSIGAGIWGLAGDIPSRQGKFADNLTKIADNLPVHREDPTPQAESESQTALGFAY